MMQKLSTLIEAVEFLKQPASTFREHRPKVGGSKIGKRWVLTETEFLA